MLDHIAAGESNAEIAAALFVAEDDLEDPSEGAGETGLRDRAGPSCLAHENGARCRELVRMLLMTPPSTTNSEPVA